MALRAVHVLRGHPRRPRGRRPEGAGLQLHEPRQHPGRRPSRCTRTWSSRRSARGRSSTREEIAETAGLDPADLDTAFTGAQPRLVVGAAPVPRRGRDPAASARPGSAAQGDDSSSPSAPRQLHLAALMGSIPSEYFMYYYFTDEIVRRAAGQADDARRGHPGRGAGLLAALRGAARQRRPAARPGALARRHQRAGAGHRRHGRRVQRPRRGAAGQRAERGRAVPDLDEDVVVEVPGRCGADWITPLPQEPLPQQVRGLVEMLAEYQVLAARRPGAATAHDAIRRSPPTRWCAPWRRPSGSTTSSPRRTARYLPERLLA